MSHLPLFVVGRNVFCCIKSNLNTGTANELFAGESRNNLERERKAVDYVSSFLELLTTETEFKAEDSTQSRPIHSTKKRFQFCVRVWFVWALVFWVRLLFGFFITVVRFRFFLPEHPKHPRSFWFFTGSQLTLTLPLLLML